MVSSLMSPVVNWLMATSLSQHIQSASWVIPVVQSIHILAIAALIGSALVLDLRFAGLVAATEPGLVVKRRYMPWMWWALVVLLASGAVLIIGEPERVLLNWVFWTKMGLLLAGVVVTSFIGRRLAKDGAQGREIGRDALVTTLGLVALLIWTLVIFCGRWIAYVL